MNPAALARPIVSQSLGARVDPVQVRRTTHNSRVKLDHLSHLVRWMCGIIFMLELWRNCDRRVSAARCGVMRRL